MFIMAESLWAGGYRKKTHNDSAKTFGLVSFTDGHAFKFFSEIDESKESLEKVQKKVVSEKKELLYAGSSILLKDKIWVGEGLLVKIKNIYGDTLEIAGPSFLEFDSQNSVVLYQGFLKFKNLSSQNFSAKTAQMVIESFEKENEFVLIAAKNFSQSLSLNKNFVAYNVYVPEKKVEVSLGHFTTISLNHDYVEPSFPKEVEIESLKKILSLFKVKNFDFNKFNQSSARSLLVQNLENDENKDKQNKISMERSKHSKNPFNQYLENKVLGLNSFNLEKEFMSKIQIQKPQIKRGVSSTHSKKESKLAQKIKEKLLKRKTEGSLTQEEEEFLKKLN
jgi:hypothetical protein